MPNEHRFAERIQAHRFRSEYGRQRQQERRDAYETGLLQGLALASLFLIPVILTLSYALTNY